MSNEFTIKRLAEKIFIKKECDINQPHIIASMITAAAEMAKASDTVSREQVIDVLAEIYNAKDNQQIGNIPSSFVKSNIGYSVDFNDYNGVQVNYGVDYERLYSEISKYILNKENEQDKTM